jgi:hypothetical protein
MSADSVNLTGTQPQPKNTFGPRAGSEGGETGSRRHWAYRLLTGPDARNITLRGRWGGLRGSGLLRYGCSAHRLRAFKNNVELELNPDVKARRILLRIFAPAAAQIAG